MRQVSAEDVRIETSAFQARDLALTSRRIAIATSPPQTREGSFESARRENQRHLLHLPRCRFRGTQGYGVVEYPSRVPRPAPSMSNSCCGIDETFNDDVARRDLERFRRKGPRGTTRRLLDGIRATGVLGTTVLDVGGGIGPIVHELLAAGVARATLIDASVAYIAAARNEAERRGELERLTTRNEDFVTVATQLAPVDIVTLDRVICCYPDMEMLVGLSTSKARRLYGVVYPRDGWWMRLGMLAVNGVCRLRKTAFRVHVHAVKAIDREIRRAGMRRRMHYRGLIWEVALYERA